MPRNSSVQCLEGLVQIVDDVVDMLRADGEPDGGGGNAAAQQLLLIHLGMGGAGGMDDQGFHVRHIGQQGEYLQMIDEPLGLRLAALDLKGEDGNAALGEILLVEGME